MTRPGIGNPGPGELQGALAFIVTQRLIDQLIIDPWTRQYEI